MFNPFFDASVLTDKEIMNKIEEVSARVVKARLAGIQYEVVESMRTVILACEEELRCRAGSKALVEVQKDNPCIFESDHDYSKDENEYESTKKQINRPQW